MSLILYDFSNYRDQYGMNQLRPGEVSQNGALFTMEYLMCLKYYTISHPEVREEFLAEVERLKSVYLSLEGKPGITCRSPGSDEYDSMDNAAANFTFSKMYGNSEVAKRILEHGRNTRASQIDTERDGARAKKWYPLAWILSGFRAPRFFWNLKNPTWFCFPGWHGRSPGHLAFLRHCAGEKMGFFGSIVMWVSQFLGCFKERSDTDARKLPYVVWQELKEINWAWKVSYKLWCWILMKQYPNGMKDVYDIYYLDPAHPLKAYSPAYLK